MRSFTACYDSPLGCLRLTSDGQSLTGLRFVDRQEADGDADAPGVSPLPVLRAACHWLDIYFSAHEPDFTPRLLLQGSDFQQRVWQHLLQIAYGHTVSYKQIAMELAAERGQKTFSAQAVGGAVARNPIAIIVPCHRVVGSHGNLTGYAGGLWRKRTLLQLEGVDEQEVFVPD